MLPVLIGTHPHRTAWLADCLKTIPTGRTVEVHRTGGFELAALRTGVRYFDRFLFLQDSMLVKHPAFWDVVDGTDSPAWLCGHPPMYVGIHDRDQLAPALDRYPAEITKEQSIDIEVDLPTHLNYSTLWPDVVDATALRREHRHDRDNLVVGNELFEKFKGTWR